MSNIINKFNKKNILVIGDLILDRYIKGVVSRISPEAPVPIVHEQESFYKPGGSANVADNLSTLGAKATLLGRVGNDFEGSLLKRCLKKSGINTTGIITDTSIPTITKTRVIAQHQQVVRIDKEKANEEPSAAFRDKVFKFIEKNIDDYHAIIISDYGKGMITKELIGYTCDLALKHKKILTVDPKVEHFNYYRRVSCITPNLKEAENAIRNIKITATRAHALKIRNDKLNDDASVNLAGEQLLRYLDLPSLLITMGERGMRLFEQGKKPVSIPTMAKEVFDVTGAGDTVIAVFTLSLSCGASKLKAAKLANVAAGIVVGKMGAVAVTKDELIAAGKNLRLK